MNRLIQGFSLCLILWSSQSTPSEYYVDSLHGSDHKSGNSFLNAWKTLKKASQQTLEAGDKLYLRSGDQWREELHLSAKGTSQQPVEITTLGSAGPAQIGRLRITDGHHLIITNLIVDADQQPVDAVLIQHSSHIRLQMLEVRNGIKDGVDIQDSQDIEIDNLHIHHFLAGSFDQQQDAHGIAATNTQRLTIESTQIHHTSGDSFQADPARVGDKMSNDIVIHNSHFWTSPLSVDFNPGWKATAHLPASMRQYPGENAIDTKVVKDNWENAPRMRITIDGLKAHGWQKDGYIQNKAIFNLKEQIDITLENLEVYDCEIAFRIRGNRGNALVSINNASIDRCETGIRAEDGIQGLRVSNSRFGNEVTKSIVTIGNATRQAVSGWSFKNNQFQGD